MPSPHRRPDLSAPENRDSAWMQFEAGAVTLAVRAASTHATACHRTAYPIAQAVPVVDDDASTWHMVQSIAQQARKRPRGRAPLVRGSNSLARTSRASSRVSTRSPLSRFQVSSSGSSADVHRVDAGLQRSQLDIAVRLAQWMRYQETHPRVPAWETPPVGGCSTACSRTSAATCEHQVGRAADEQRAADSRRRHFQPRWWTPAKVSAADSSAGNQLMDRQAWRPDSVRFQNRHASAKGTRTGVRTADRRRRDRLRTRTAGMRSTSGTWTVW